MRQEQRAADVDSFTWFFTCEYPQVVRLLTVVVHDSAAAEDVAQEAFVRLHRHWEKVSRYESPEAWVRRVALNRAFSHLRSDQARRRLARLAADGDVVSLDRTGAATSHVDVVRAVKRLPKRDAALVALYHLEDRPLSEVAEVLGMSVGSAKVALHRARRRLAELLEEVETAS